VLLKGLKKFDGWKKEVTKAENEIHIAIIRKYVNEAGKWIFSAKEGVTKDLRENESTHPIISDKQYVQESSKIQDNED